MRIEAANSVFFGESLFKTTQISEVARVSLKELIRESQSAESEVDNFNN